MIKSNMIKPYSDQEKRQSDYEFSKTSLLKMRTILKVLMVV
jgi:hypothetical protein